MSPYPVPPPRPSDPAPTRRYGSIVLLTLGFVLIAVCAVVVTLAVLLSTGPTSFAIGVLFALVPVAPLLAFFGWLDRYEPEPRGYLVFAFGWGAAVATLGSLVINSTSIYLLDTAGRDSEYVGTVFVAPIVEEALKGLGLLTIVWISRRGLDSVVDGIVYAGLIGVGFAFVENILYLGAALTDGGSAGLIATFVARGILSPFAHPLFTAAFGIGLALAARNKGAGRLLVLIGYVVAVGLHALWNANASTDVTGFLAGFIMIHVPIFLIYVGLALWSRAREGRLIRTHLQPYAATGWVTPAEVEMLSDLRLRRQALAGAAPGSRSQVRRFQQSAVSLAHLRARMDAGSAPRGGVEMERRLLADISAQRV
ncbi:MAG: PrsW family intramembrane metalloprotease [Gemmatimonadota bacterium]|nr:PrsW family intramembrane metalloprotease [Gemmatimonadota bacterium]